MTHFISLYTEINMLLITPEIPGQPSELEIKIATVVFSVMIIGIFILPFYLAFDLYKNRKWKKGIFPSKLNFTDDNYLRAYICLSSNMMRRDNRDTSGKLRYAKHFFKKEFPNSKYDSTALLKFSLRHPIQLDTVCFWLNEHLSNEQEKLKIIHLLSSIAMLDGSLTKNELWLLRELIRILELDQSDLETILKIYIKENQGVQNNNFSLSKAEECFNILEIPLNSSLKEIKKAYRKLAMMNHPDKFVSVGEKELRLAQERFLKIQQAYEYLIVESKTV